MKSIRDIKALAKERFRALYWPSVGVSVLVSAVLGVILGLMTVLSPIISTLVSRLVSVRLLTIGLSHFFSAIVPLLVSGPLTIGLSHFFILLIHGQEAPTVGVPFRTAFTKYGRKLGGYLWMELFSWLWSAVLLIPGIVKRYAYALTPYILADCPEVRIRDALRLSIHIMRGKKLRLFLLHLSFIGWGILTACTFGILGIFYTGPYLNASIAAFYLEAREDALKSGTITIEQLEGTARA